MSLRIRQIKGDWWLDKELQTQLTADQREFYIGLWQLADDGGWFEWDPVRIGAALYPFRSASRRERLIALWADSLMTLSPEAPHLVILECGHARVPKMPAHQRLGVEGKQVHSIGRRHRECGPPRDPTGTSGDPTLVGNGRETGRGTERNGTTQVSAQTRNDERGTSEFQILVPRPDFTGRKSA